MTRSNGFLFVLEGLSVKILWRGRQLQTREIEKIVSCGDRRGLSIVKERRVRWSGRGVFGGCFSLFGRTIGITARGQGYLTILCSWTTALTDSQTTFAREMLTPRYKSFFLGYRMPRFSMPRICSASSWRGAHSSSNEILLQSLNAKVNGDCASIRPRPVSQLLLNWRWDPSDAERELQRASPYQTRYSYTSQANSTAPCSSHLVQLDKLCQLDRFAHTLKHRHIHNSTFAVIVYKEYRVVLE